MVIFENVYKEFPDGTVAVKDFNLKINKGELIVFVGPSGCGKTTTLKMINRLIEPTSGKVYVEGKDVSSVNPVTLRRSIGYVIQDIGLFPHMTIEENIAIVAKMLKWSKDKTASRVEELLILAGLTPPAKYKNRLPEQLSGGQQQRIGVLRALSVEPNVILMDEPFSSLDPISRENLQTELKDLQKKLKKTVVFVTHDMDEAFKLADRVVLMNKGEIVQIGTPNDIKLKPAHEFVKTFIGLDRIMAFNASTFVDLILEKPELVLRSSEVASQVLERVENPKVIQVVDESGCWLGSVFPKDLEHGAQLGLTLGQIASIERRLLIESATLADAAILLREADVPIPIINQDHKLLGVASDEGMARITIDWLINAKNQLLEPTPDQ